MRLRDRAVRTIFVVGVFTTIATSAPEDFPLEGVNARLLAAQETIHVDVVYSSDAARADALAIDFEWSGTLPVTVVPDDPNRAPVTFAAFQTIDVIELCAGDGPCELGFSVDPEDGTGRITVTARSFRNADPSFCFPDNRDFDPDASIEVIFE